MDIHEYQAKDVLAKFGVQVAQGALAYSPEQAAYRARELGGDKWVVKAQVHAVMGPHGALWSPAGGAPRVAPQG